MKWERILRGMGWFVLIMGIFVGIVGYINQNSVTYIDGEPVENWKDIPFFTDFYANISVEFISFAATILILDFLNERRQERQLKAQLIRQLGSYYPNVAVTAANELRHLGWGFGEDRSLVRALLEKANLEGAFLEGINLEMAFLQGVNLENAWMANANLETTRLRDSNLKGTHLMQANLKYAHATQANLEDAVLYEAELDGAYMVLANLTRAYLEGASLKGTSLDAANLLGANLYRAKHVTPQLLVRVKSFTGAVMPDGSRPEEWILRLFGEGEIDEETFIKLSKLAKNYVDEEE